MDQDNASQLRPYFAIKIGNSKMVLDNWYQTLAALYRTPSEQWEIDTHKLDQYLTVRAYFAVGDRKNRPHLKLTIYRDELFKYVDNLGG